MNLLACKFDSVFEHWFFSFKLIENRLKQIKVLEHRNWYFGANDVLSKLNI